jgi:hypothetical protein
VSLGSEKNILFVIHLTGCTSNNDIIKLTKAIEASYPSLKFKILVIRLYEPVLTNIEKSEKIIFYEDIATNTWNCTEEYTYHLANNLKVYLSQNLFKESQTIPI